jgi:hypothetical protein
MFRIRVHMFLGPTDPDLVKGTVRIRIWILPSSSKNSKKNLYFYCFVTFYDLLSFTKEKSWTRIGSVNQRYASVDPDPYQNVADRNSGPNSVLNEVKCTI